MEHGPTLGKRIRRIVVQTAAGALLLVLFSGCSGLAQVDPSVFPPPARDAVTFWGHACCYIDVGGLGIVTDPVFEKNVANRRRGIPSPPPSSYENARVVVISHAHPDHLSPPSLKTFPPETVILCPEPSAKYIKDVGREVRVMKVGDVYEFEGGRIIAVPAQHMGGRWSISADDDGRALGYVIETPAATLFYSGDTNYFDGFEHVGQTYQPDIAILNINGHMHSNDAVHAAWDTHAKFIIPMHFGAYGYFFMSAPERPRDYKDLEMLLDHQLVTLGISESFPLSTATSKEPVLP